MKFSQQKDKPLAAIDTPEAKIIPLSEQPRNQTEKTYEAETETFDDTVEIDSELANLTEQERTFVAESSREWISAFYNLSLEAYRRASEVPHYKTGDLVGEFLANLIGQYEEYIINRTVHPRVKQAI